jgi:L-asparaginase
MPNQHVSILLTGGTIDSYFSAADEAIKINQKATIKKYLDFLCLHVAYDFQVICRKDSRNVNEKDREKLLKAIVKSSSKNFLILHGTYTMPDTAKFLHDHRKKFPGKVVTLTGSMVPLEGFAKSDAPFNLGFAIASLLYQKPGVYLAMNGNMFRSTEVYKHIKKGRFEYSE